jgi:hypothetical protein
MDISVAKATTELLKRRQQINTIASLFTVSFGLVLVLIAGGKALLNYEYNAHGVEVVATVTDSSYIYSNRSSYHTVSYAFSVPDGRRFRGTQTGYSGARGGSILVAYLPARPSFNRVAGSEQRDRKWLPVVAIAGAFFLLAGMQSYLKQKANANN